MVIFGAPTWSLNQKVRIILIVYSHIIIVCTVASWCATVVLKSRYSNTEFILNAYRRIIKYFFFSSLCTCFLWPGLSWTRAAFLNDVVIIWFCFISWSADWGPNIDIVGFCFLDLASNYEPPKPLVDWLEEGKNPIYVGFGSLVSLYNFSMYNLQWNIPPKIINQ